MKAKITEDFLDLYLESAKNSYERIYDTRQNFRDRTVTIISIFIGVLGAIIVLSGKDTTFLDLFQAKSDNFQYAFIGVISIAMLTFLITFLIARSAELDSQYDRMNCIIQKTKSIDESGEVIKLVEEELTVNAVGFAKVDLIRSYSKISDDLIANLKILKCVYVLSITCFLTAIVLAIATLL